MADGFTTGSDSAGSWSVLDRGNWETADELLIRLADAVGELDAGEGTVLHDHVAIDAVLDALAPGSESRGVSEVTFEYGRYEVKITRNGTIAAAPGPTREASRTGSD